MGSSNENNAIQLRVINRLVTNWRVIVECGQWCKLMASLSHSRFINILSTKYNWCFKPIDLQSFIVNFTRANQSCIDGATCLNVQSNYSCPLMIGLLIVPYQKMHKLLANSRDLFIMILSYIEPDKFSDLAKNMSKKASFTYSKHCTPRFLVQEYVFEF